jgi:hypothetical protein
MGGTEALSGFVGIAVVVFLVILTIAWTLLPFAMFGLKPLVRELIAETRRTNQLLEGIASTRTDVALGEGNIRTRADR